VLHRDYYELRFCEYVKYYYAHCIYSSLVVKKISPSGMFYIHTVCYIFFPKNSQSVERFGHAGVFSCLVFFKVRVSGISEEGFEVSLALSLARAVVFMGIRYAHIKRMYLRVKEDGCIYYYAMNIYICIYIYMESLLQQKKKRERDEIICFS